MAIEVFNRYEKKYMINMEMYLKIKEQLELYMEEDEHSKGENCYEIANLYYDTISNDLISHSISSPVYKEKLRLRGYGVPTLDTKVYLEIKKKYNGIVNKRRCAIKLSEAYKFIETKEIPKIQPYMNEQILFEIKRFLEQYELKPMTYLAYDRKAYFQKENRDLRISFDFNIRTRRENKELEFGNEGKLLLDQNSVLMEIKVSNNMPLWLTSLLSENKIYPIKFSKYGTEFLQFKSTFLRTSKIRGSFVIKTLY